MMTTFTHPDADERVCWYCGQGDATIEDGDDTAAYMHPACKLAAEGLYGDEFTDAERADLTARVASGDTSLLTYGQWQNAVNARA